jgi:hypothetical protein
MCSKLVTTHPQFHQAIKSLGDRSLIDNTRYHDWKVAHSIARQFIIDALHALVAQASYKEQPLPTQSWGFSESKYGDVLSLWSEPWTRPTIDHVEKLKTALPLWPGVDRGYSIDAGYLLNPEKYFDHQKYRLSAAAVAINYLSSLPAIRCSELRCMTLHEDPTSISWPESHAKGLILFCQQNLQLKIERKLSLWRTVLPGGSAPLFNVVQGMDTSLPGRHILDTLQSKHVSGKCIGPWISEALVLTDAGMPSGAFTLVFQCDSIPGKSAQVFEIFKQDASWQTAFQRCFLTGELTRQAEEWHVVRWTDTYVSRGFPDAVRKLCSGVSPIKCEFDLDDSCDVDVDRLVETARDWE